MLTWLKQLDRILRGEATRVSVLRSGTIDVPAGGLVVLIILLGFIYGLCMGSFAVTGSGSGAPMQIPAAMVKVPALFLLTLLVTFPSLYVFNALVGSRLSFLSLLRLLVAAIAVMLSVLASLGPIVAFFGVSTTTPSPGGAYSFILLLNVAVFAVSGFLGLGFLLQTLHRLTIAQYELDQQPPPTPPDSALSAQNSALPSPPPGALDRATPRPPAPNVRAVFRIWVIVYGLVGAQMAWILRPFVGRPGAPFEWFRHRGSNFFQGVWTAIQHLIS